MKANSLNHVVNKDERAIKFVKPAGQNETTFRSIVLKLAEIKQLIHKDILV
jgi:hypothetical protein